MEQVTLANINVVPLREGGTIIDNYHRTQPEQHSACKGRFNWGEWIDEGTTQEEITEQELC